MKNSKKVIELFSAIGYNSRIQYELHFMLFNLSFKFGRRFFIHINRH